MIKYDDASWHYGGDFPKDLDSTRGATHIGMFLTWCIDHDLVSESQREEAAEDLERVKARELSGTEFLMSNCDEKFTEEDLIELGNSFARDYYNDESAFAEQFAPYIEDYCLVFEKAAGARGNALESIYHVVDSWANYDLLLTVIDKRFREWKAFSAQAI